MLAYIVLSLSMAMGLFCAPLDLFNYPDPHATERLVADRISQAEVGRQLDAPKFTGQYNITSSDSLDDDDEVNHRMFDHVINPIRPSRYERNFLRQTLEVMDWKAMLKISDDDKELWKSSEQTDGSWPTVDSDSISGEPRARRPYEEGSVFDGSSDDEFTEHAPTPTNAARYSSTPDEEYTLPDGTKIKDSDFMNLLKSKKKKRYKRNDRRQKREDVIFTDSYYPESAEDIVERVLRAHAREEKDSDTESDEDADDLPYSGNTIISSASILPRSIIPGMGMKKLLPMLNKTMNFFKGEKKVKQEDFAKVFEIDLAKLAMQYQQYYLCLAEKKKKYMETLGRPMENIQHMIVSSSMQVTLKCHTCLPPLAIARNYGVRWMRRRLSVGGFDDVPKDDSEVDNFAMDDDGVLYIQGLVLEDAGMYTCFKNGAQEVTYFIGVENAVDRRMVQESWTNLRDMPAKPKTLALNNLYMFTQWSDWTECNLCNQRGQRKRIGMCMVKKMVSSQKTRPKEAIILVRYPEGVPCRSALLPQFITNKTDLRPSEFMVGYCFMDCTTLVPVTYITDMDGKTVEVVLTGKGRKSLRGTAPPMPKEVERSTKYVDDGGRITLQCVASEEEDKKQPIRWQNGSQMINELTLERESKGRVYVDMDNQLVIKHATKYDRGVYSCWKNLVRLSIIRLMVSAPTDVSILSIISGFCFVVFVFMMIYLGVHMVKFSSLKPVDKVFRHHAKLRKKGKNGEGKQGKGKQGKGKKGKGKKGRK